MNDSAIWNDTQAKNILSLNCFGKLKRYEISVITPQNGSFNPTGTTYLFCGPVAAAPCSLPPPHPSNNDSDPKRSH